jgi:hypothetical protein
MGVKMGDFAKGAIIPVRPGKMIDLSKGVYPKVDIRGPRISGGGRDKPPKIAMAREKR